MWEVVHRIGRIITEKDKAYILNYPWVNAKASKLNRDYLVFKSFKISFNIESYEKEDAKEKNCTKLP